MDRLQCLNPEALGAGLECGMALAEARAVVPDLATAPADPLREAAGLERLRRFAMRYSPQVGLDGADGLVADVTGVAHLFGGEAELCADVQARFERAGFAVQIGLAQSRGGAWAMSRYGGGIVPEGGLVAAMGPLPLEALRLPEDLRQGLVRMGLQRISDLMALPRAPLSRRFGPLVLQRLDQMLGLLPEPVAAPVGERYFAARLSLPEPIGRSADVMAGVGRLLPRLCAKLSEAQLGARRLRLELQRVDHQVVVLEIGLARPLRDPERIAALFAPQVEEADAGFGIEVLRLEAHVVEPLAPQQIAAGGAAPEDDLADLVSRLGNRLGFERVLRLAPRPSRLPEQSFKACPALEGREQPAGPQGPRLARPLTLFPPELLFAVSGHPPVSFTWRRRVFTTLRLQGPERITPDWWDIPPGWSAGLRDYWRVETREGPRLWLFHTPRAPGWAVEGEFP